MALSAIEAEHIRKTYTSKSGEVGLRDLSLHVAAGQVLALLGPNGAGKTTVVRGLSTLLEFDRGSVRIAGYDVRRDAAKVRERIGLIGQYAAVDEQLTGFQNLRFFARLHGLGPRASADRAGDLLEQFGLSEAQHRAVRGYSGGMRRRLDLAASLIVPPQVLFVDEPTTGLDPAARRELWASLRELVRDGTSILLTTQYLEEDDELADEVVLLARGVAVAQGSPEDLKSMVGPPLIRLRFSSSADAALALTALRGIDGGTEMDPSGSVVTVPGASHEALARTLDALASIGVTASEVTLRKPSLDDVFLTLTEDAPATEESA